MQVPDGAGFWHESAGCAGACRHIGLHGLHGVRERGDRDGQQDAARHGGPGDRGNPLQQGPSGLCDRRAHVRERRHVSRAGERPGHMVLVCQRDTRVRRHGGIFQVRLCRRRGGQRRRSFHGRDYSRGLLGREEAGHLHRPVRGGGPYAVPLRGRGSGGSPNSLLPLRQNIGLRAK